jgi:hypothetical protein
MTIQRAPDGAARGQVLIMTAAAMLALIAIAALVFDLGMSWMLRRDQQNAVDPGAVAAARFIPADDVGMMQEVACRYARENGFFDSATTDDMTTTGCVTANDPSSAKLEVRVPPSGPLAGQYAGTPGFVQVLISSTHPSFFGQFFGRDPAWVTTSAVGAWTDENANSSSLVALDPTCDNGPAGKISGSSATVKIVPAPGVTGDGGYVHVNSSCATHLDGAPDQCTNGTTDLKIDSANLITPHAYVHGECTLNGSGANLTCPVGVSDCLTEGAVQIGDPLASLIAPTIEEVTAAYGVAKCPDGSESTITSNPCDFKKAKCKIPDGTEACEVDPGVYYGGWNITQSGIEVKLSPGIYYIAGGGIRLNSGTIESISGDPLVEARVMIYSTDHPTRCSLANPDWCQGPIRMQASSTFAAKGLNDNTCTSQPVTCPYRGILVWQEQRVLQPGQEVRLGGQNTSVVAGTIYAPKSNVILNGGSNSTGCGAGPNQACLSVQVIAWQFDITGGGVLEMPYDPSQIYQVQNKGLVH